MTKKGIGVAVAFVVLAVAAGLAYKSRDHAEQPTPIPDAAAGVDPKPSDPAMTTESVPTYRDDGVVPAPSDAFGTTPPQTKTPPDQP